MLIIPIYYVSRNNTSSNIQLDDVRIKEENRKKFAIMVKENDNEDYKSYEGSTWPTNYIYNKSECIDSNGTITEVDVKYENNNIIINTSKTVYCTIYFDKDTKSPEIKELYIISNPTPQYTNTSDGKVKVTMTWEDSDVSSYCINTSATTNNCEWIPIDNVKQITKDITLSEGRNNIYGYIKDKAENISSVKEGTIILDRQAPTVDETLTKAEVTETSATITVVVDDIKGSEANETSGIKEYCYSMKNTNTLSDFKCVTYKASGGNAFTIDKDASDAALKSGTQYKYYVYAVDNAGNGNPTTKTTLNFTTKQTAGGYVDDKITGDNVGNGGYGPSGATGVIDPLVKRFYGENPNNYICFGAASCSNNDDHIDHMYRIIGVTSDGKLKIMKQKPLNSFQDWGGVSATWETSYLISDLNDGLFYNNEKLVPTTSINWKQYIEPNPSWCIGNVDYSSESTNGSTVLQAENKTCKVIANSPISIMSLSDYCFSNDITGNTGCYKSGCRSWMTYGSAEWTMTPCGSGTAWSIYSSGNTDYQMTFSNEYVVRPVFYLVSNVKLSGNGKVDDPFVIIGLA